METMTHRWRAEITTEKRSPFMTHRCLAALDLFLDTMLTGEHVRHDRLIVWKSWVTDTGTDPDTQLGYLVHSVMVEQLPEHELVCGSEPA
jgi:hypothetical protein